MSGLKHIIFKLFIFYFNNFPIERGKYRLATIINFLFGSFKIIGKDDIWIEVFANSIQDLYLLSIPDSDLVYKEVSKLRSGDLFVDVGANIGFFSLLASKRVGSSGVVISFEPSKREFMRMCHAILLNNSHNIMSFNNALSSKSGVILIDVDQQHTGMNKLSLSTSSSSFVDLVAGFKLDELTPFLNDRNIDLLKIDVEGAEMLVLEGMSNLLSEKRIIKLIVEITPKFLAQYGHTKHDLFVFLKDRGYKPTINSEDWQYDEIFLC
jgi:FkbM family methyltransferase